MDDTAADLARWLRTHGGAVDEFDFDAQQDFRDTFLAPLLADAHAAGVAEVAVRVKALADEWESWSRVRSTPRIDTFRDAAERLRAALAGTSPQGEGER